MLSPSSKSLLVSIAATDAVPDIAMSSSNAGESDRPDHPIFAACSTADGRVPKKIPFRSARTLSVAALKERVSQRVFIRQNETDS